MYGPKVYPIRSLSEISIDRSRCCGTRSRAISTCIVEILILIAAVIGFLAYYEVTDGPYEDARIAALEVQVALNWTEPERHDSRANRSVLLSKSDEEELAKWKLLHHFYVRSMAITAGAFAVGMFTIILSIHGILKEKPMLLVLHMVVQVSVGERRRGLGRKSRLSIFFQIIAAVVLLAIVILYSLAEGPTNMQVKREALGVTEDHLAFGWALIGCCVTAIIFLGFAFVSIVSYYRFLKQERSKGYE